MIRFAPSLRRRRLSLAVGTSALAWALACPTAVSAQCAPDPTTAEGTTICAGLDSDGLAITTSRTQIVVESGATVRPGLADAAMRIGATETGLTVDGLIDGAGKAGISVVAGPVRMVPCDPYAGASVHWCTPGTLVPSHPSASATITIGAGGIVTGAQALSVSRDPDNFQGLLDVKLVNAGTMTGTAGPAIVATGTSFFGTASVAVSNLSTGTIAGIFGNVYSMLSATGLPGSRPRWGLHPAR